LLKSAYIWRKTKMVTNQTKNSVYKEKDTDYVCMEWSGYHDSATFRRGTEEMLEELTRHNTGKVLADIKNMVLIGMEDQSWLLDEFLPRAIGQGFAAIAIVRPTHYFNKVAVETIAYKVNQEKLRIQFFDDLSEAKKWLKEFRKIMA
jgi:hypothetical protein